MTYKPEHYIKGLNIHSVRDLFLPAKVSATLDLMMPDVSKKSNFYKKAFLLLCFIEAAEGFTYTFDAHFAEHTRHCAMPLYIMEIETIACKHHTAPKMLCTLREFKEDFFKIIRKGQCKKIPTGKKIKHRMQFMTLKLSRSYKNLKVSLFESSLGFLATSDTEVPATTTLVLLKRNVTIPKQA